MRPPRKLPNEPLRNPFLTAGWLTCVFTGLAMHASAQWDPSSSGSSSEDTFDGDPSTSKFIRIPSDTYDWTRHFHIGAMVGLNISASFKESGNFNVSGNSPANGIYDNGYVKPDQSGDPNHTSNWGYNNASQYNSAAQTLSMQATSSYSTSGSSKDDGGPFPGFDLAYGGNLWYWKHARVGWEFGFGLLPINIKDHSSLNAMVTQSTYIYDVSNPLNAPLPQAPYQGSSSGVGHLIPTGSSQSTVTLPDQTITGTRQLDVNLYTFRLGPSFYWDLTEHFGMALGAGPAVGFVTGDYKYDEVVTVSGTSSRTSGKFGTTDFVFGGYVNGTLLYHVLDNADIYLGAQYMPLGHANFSSGGRQAQLDLGGQVYVSAGISWPF